MDGFKILVSGFDNNEKAEIEMIIKGMGWQLLTKISSDVNIVVVKSVAAAKYKWALNVLKKPIVTADWLRQCWEEHRAVPHKPFRVLPFAGLTISVTKINSDERKSIETTVIENGGKYSPELTKMCTHLIANAQEGDKYKVARRWGHIHIVSRKWFDDSVIKKVCLNEDNYPVQVAPLPSTKVSQSTYNKHENLLRKSKEPTSSASTACHESDLEATLSQNMTTMFSDPYKFAQEAHEETNVNEEKKELDLENCVANDSQSSDDDDLYLSECIIAIVGFEEYFLRKLVNMVRRGGGTQRPISVPKLTHVIVGAPSESEKKVVRNVAASGVINVVKPLWLEDCNCEKKEVNVQRRHTAYDLLIPKDSSCGLYSNSQSKIEIRSSINDEVISTNNDASKEYTPSITTIEENTITVQSSPPVFKGKMFRFSDSFPEDRRGEIIEWISKGGGELSNDTSKDFVHFQVDCHGLQTEPGQPAPLAIVSTHWIKSCLEHGSLLDTKSHILYSPLPCTVPFPGFQGLRFCISQYDEKERSLMRNLCFVLGTKLVEKLTQRVTHLLCKYASGPKFEAAHRWGITPVTCEWVFDCIRRNQIGPTELFRPNPDQPTQSSFSQFSLPPKKPRLADDGPRSGNDVAASIDVIEGLYELAQDEQLVGRIACEKNIFPQDCAVANEECSSELWISRTGEVNTAKPSTEELYNFSETQTESQVVGYEEDLSGRQMLIDRVRLRSSFS